MFRPYVPHGTRKIGEGEGESLSSLNYMIELIRKNSVEIFGSIIEVTNTNVTA